MNSDDTTNVVPFPQRGASNDDWQAIMAQAIVDLHEEVLLINKRVTQLVTILKEKL